MKESGQIMKGININFDTIASDIIVGGHSIFVKDGYYIFGGHTPGYKTKYQEVAYDAVTPTYDSFVFKYSPTEDNSCFYQDEISSSTLRRDETYTKRFSESDVAVLSSDRYLFKKMSKVYIGYSSRYSGSFDLLDTFRYPKMCAATSMNMTNGVHYYRGQNELVYVIGEDSSAGSALDDMDRGKSWLFQNGTDATNWLGRFDEYH